MPPTPTPTPVVIFTSVRHVIAHPPGISGIPASVIRTSTHTQDYVDEEDEDYEYDGGNAEGGLTGTSDSANANGGSGGGAVDLLSMDDLSINDTPAPAPIPAAGAAPAGGGGGIIDLFGGGGVAAGAPAAPAVQKTVRVWVRFARLFCVPCAVSRMFVPALCALPLGGHYSAAGPALVCVCVCLSVPSSLSWFVLQALAEVWRFIRT